MRRTGDPGPSSVSSLNGAQPRTLASHSEIILGLLSLVAVISVTGSSLYMVLCTISFKTAEAALSREYKITFPNHNISQPIDTPATPRSTFFTSSQNQYEDLAVSQLTAISQTPQFTNSLQNTTTSKELEDNFRTLMPPIKNIFASLGRPRDTEILPTEKLDENLLSEAVETMPETSTLYNQALKVSSQKKTNEKIPNDFILPKDHWKMNDAVHPRIFHSKHHHEHHWGPFFEEPVSSVTPGESLVSAVHLFTEAVLNCRVGMLKDKTVMWIRRTNEKVSLLTVGNVTYSGDPRIRIKFQYPNNWRLLINPTQAEDAGTYMCQVSTHPPRLFTTNLTVLEPPLRIIDEHDRDIGDRYYKSGSTVDLQCQISRHFFEKEHSNILKTIEKYSDKHINNITFEELYAKMNTNRTQGISNTDLEKHFKTFITWAKDEEALKGLTIKRASVSKKWLTSRISIEDAKLSDSGNYSCSLGRLFTVIVQVQVLTGELPAAVQHNIATKFKCGFFMLLGVYVAIVYFYANLTRRLRII